MKSHYKIKVEGRVQGVFFRVSTQKEAKKLDLKGFVRNEPDGSVYIEVEGEQSKIDLLISWLTAGGPPNGRVDHYELSDGKIQDYISFDIR